MCEYCGPYTEEGFYVSPREAAFLARRAESRETAALDRSFDDAEWAERQQEGRS